MNVTVIEISLPKSLAKTFSFESNETNFFHSQLVQQTESDLNVLASKLKKT